MIFRRLEAEDRMQAEDLWIRVFEDSPAFTSYYFEERFRPEHSYAAFDGDRMAAMVQGRPTHIFAEGRWIPAMLTAGVSTLPEYRGRGLMHRLMSLLIDHAKHDGFSCCYLHPVAELLYASFGFQNGADVLTVHSETERKHEPYILSEQFRADDLLLIYHALQQTHDGMQMRDEEELNSVFRDYAIDDAKVLIAYRNEHPMGYIVYCPDGLVYELMALTASAYAFLLDETANRVGREIKATAPIDCGMPGERHYGMQYLVFDNAFALPLKNGFCPLTY